MNIIIAGGGKVGSTLVSQLAAEGHDLTLIDWNKTVLDRTINDSDVLSVQGNCAAMDTLLTARVREADLLIAATNLDEVNLLCCMTAHGLNKNIHTIARIRNPEYTQQIYKMRDSFGLSFTVNPERQAALEIEKLLKYPGFLRRDTFVGGRTEIVELRLDADSKLIGIALSEMYKTVKARVLVCALVRKGQAYSPKGDFVLESGDKLYITAPTANLTALLKNLGVITRKVRRVLLCGGDRISFYLAQLLEKDGMDVTIIEQNSERCRFLAEELPEASVIQGDCSDQARLEEEGITSADAVVTLTGIDEMNMIVSLYASSRKVPQVITKIGRPENARLADSLALGSIICPREISSGAIVRYVRAMQNQESAAITVHAIADGQAEAVEFLVEEDTPHCGEPLKALKLKPDVLIASISRQNRPQVPGGDSVFLPGDTVVIVTSGRGTIRSLEEIFA